MTVLAQLLLFSTVCLVAARQCTFYQHEVRFGPVYCPTFFCADRLDKAIHLTGLGLKVGSMAGTQAEIMELHDRVVNGEPTAEAIMCDISSDFKELCKQRYKSAITKATTAGTLDDWRGKFIVFLKTLFGADLVASCKMRWNPTPELAKLEDIESARFLTCELPVLDQKVITFDDRTNEFFKKVDQCGSTKKHCLSVGMQKLLQVLVKAGNPMKVVSLVRNDGPHGGMGKYKPNYDRQGRQFQRAVDIGEYDGKRLNILHPDEAHNGIVELIRLLPPGKYWLGFPRAPYQSHCNTTCACSDQSLRCACTTKVIDCPPGTIASLPANDACELNCNYKAADDYNKTKRQKEFLALWATPVNASCPCLDDKYLPENYVLSESKRRRETNLQQFIDREWNGKTPGPGPWVDFIINDRYRGELRAVLGEVATKVTVAASADGIDHFHIQVDSEMECSVYDVCDVKECKE